MTDIVGAKIRFDAAMRRTYLSIDQNKCRRIARQLIDGNHLNHYGLESARTIVTKNAEQVAKAVIVRPSAKLVKHQRANNAVVAKQLKVAMAVELATGKAHALHELNKKIRALEVEYNNSTSRKQRRNIKFLLHAMRNSL